MIYKSENASRLFLSPAVSVAIDPVAILGLCDATRPFKRRVNARFAKSLHSRRLGLLEKFGKECLTVHQKQRDYAGRTSEPDSCTPQAA